jgi:hypothetical protein
MNVLYLVLLLLAAICFAVAAFTGRSVLDSNGARTGGRGLALIPLGLLFWVLVPLIQTIDGL